MTIQTSEKASAKPKMATTFPLTAFYTAANKVYAAGARYVGECTWYCWGRTLELGKADRNILPAGNAKTWFQAAKLRGFLTGVQPQRASIACWNTGAYGHVAFVEDITDGILFSEANWYAASDIRLSNSQINTPYTAVPGTDGQYKGPMTRSRFEARLPGFQGYIYLL